MKVFSAAALALCGCAAAESPPKPTLHFDAGQTVAEFSQLNSRIAVFQSPFHPPADGGAIFHGIKGLEITGQNLDVAIVLRSYYGDGSAVASFDTFHPEKKSEAPERVQDISFRPAFSNNNAVLSKALLDQFFGTLGSRKDCHQISSGKEKYEADYPDLPTLQKGLDDKKQNLSWSWSFQCGEVLLHPYLAESRTQANNPADHGYDFTISVTTKAQYEEQLRLMKNALKPISEDEARAIKERLKKLLDQAQ